MFDTFLQNGSLFPSMNHFVPFLALLIPLAVLDMALKGWGMWRAAKMNKNGWFIALLVVNSLGLLPAIFLLLTKDEYEKFKKQV